MKQILHMVCLCGLLMVNPVNAGALLPGADDFSKGDAAYQRHEVKAAIAAYEAAAKRGHAGALFRLGEIYSNGQDVKFNIQSVLSYYKRAADLGHARANFLYGMLYYDDRDIEKDTKIAEQYIRRGAERGDGNAQVMLAGFYEDGEIVKADWVEAWKWYELAVRSKQLVDMHQVRDMLGKNLTPTQLSEAKRRADAWKPLTH